MLLLPSRRSEELEYGVSTLSGTSQAQIKTNCVGAEMFLIFALRRPDVLSTTDLGIQRGMAHWIGKNIKTATSKSGKYKYMNEQEMTSHAESWRPFRSLGCWYMWRFDGERIASNTPSTAKIVAADAGLAS